MKMNKLITAAAVALASVAFVQTASAQFVNGDLLLNFRVNDGAGQGAGQDLEVDLGQASAFDFTTSHAVTVLNASDLSSIFGTSGTPWQSRTDLVFSIVGAAGTTTEFLSNPNNSSFTVTTGLQGNEGTIASLYAETSGTNTSGTSYNVSASDHQSYTDVLTNASGTHIGSNAYSNDFNFIPGTIGASEQTVSSTGSSLDLYEITTTGTGKSAKATATDLGTFTVEGNGTLEFTSATAAPEPSTYALMGLGALALFFVRRRAMQA